LRQQLLAEINDVHSSDDAAIWAHRSMKQKNALTTADAQIVEERFHARLMSLSAPVEVNPSHEDTRSAAAETSPETTTSLHADEMASTKACSACPNRGVSVIGSTSGRSWASHA
jgi:hypothetical protein